MILAFRYTMSVYALTHLALIGRQQPFDVSPHEV